MILNFVQRPERHMPIEIAVDASLRAADVDISGKLRGAAVRTSPAQSVADRPASDSLAANRSTMASA